MPVDTTHSGRVDGPSREGIPDDGKAPKYYLAKLEVAALLDELGEGERVPAERELAARFGVARETLRQALQELALEGRIRRQGRGTVVAGPKVIQPLSLLSYTEAVRTRGLRSARIPVAEEHLRADPVLAADLELDDPPEVWHLERVIAIEDEPVGLESDFIPWQLVAEVAHEYDPRTSLYAFLRERLDLGPADAEERIETVLASPREAALIGTNPALPMLVVHRLSWDERGRPFERSRTLYRGDRFGVSTRLRNPD
jgi:GntR family transcriptional regulator